MKTRKTVLLNLFKKIHVIVHEIINGTINGIIKSL